jgi:predicted RNA-binding Zn ribbon-like protein
MGVVSGIDRIGGHSAIDFVNTCGGLPEGPDDEYLFSYEDLLIWMSEARLLEPTSVDFLRAAGRRYPKTAETTFVRAVRLRAGLDGVLRTTLDDEASPDAADLTTIEDIYYDALAHARLTSQPSGRFGWKWQDDAIDQPVWLVAQQAVDLLQAAPLHLLRQCGHCRWLFLDTSRNHNRRWCRMEACGSIMKMRRFRVAHSASNARQQG